MMGMRERREQQQADALLHQMLPKSVADQLKQNGTVSPEYYQNVTIFFSDVVGFMTMTKDLPTTEMINLLTDIYKSFEERIDHFNVYKVETIGDSHMVVSGMPEANDRHAGEIADLSLDIMSNVSSMAMPGLPSTRLQLRIGIHSGAVMAGIVGTTRPRYCVFGDTVNTASRMETNGLGDKIHMSKKSWRLLERLGGYVMTRRGTLDIKGKGRMTTYFLEGKVRENQVIPVVHQAHDGGGSGLSKVIMVKEAEFANRVNSISDLDADMSSVEELCAPPPITPPVKSQSKGRMTANSLEEKIQQNGQNQLISTVDQVHEGEGSSLRRIIQVKEVEGGDCVVESISDDDMSSVEELRIA